MVTYGGIYMGKIKGYMIICTIFFIVIICSVVISISKTPQQYKDSIVYTTTLNCKMSQFIAFEYLDK